MPTPNVLVVAVDGLRASALGAYGNTTFATPELDRFATQSFLLDCCYAPASDLPDVYRALWQSTHPLRSFKTPLSVPVRDRERGSETAASSMTSSLPKLLAAQGYETFFVSDDDGQLLTEASQNFNQCVQVTPSGSQTNPPARNVSQTGLARLFATACDLIQQQRNQKTAGSAHAHTPRLIWVHSRGMYGPWDAPLQFQEILLDEGDPAPLDQVTPPDIELSRSDDPDTTFHLACAYAAQTMVLDACWAAIMEAVGSASQQSPWLVVLVGLRGFPLGEHRRIGGVDERLHGEQLHVPWIVRFPGGRGALGRSAALTSHLDLLPTILDSIDRVAEIRAAGIDGASILPLLATSHAPWREGLISTSAAGGRSIRTVNWCLRQDAIIRPDSSESTHGHAAMALYVRPDDRWEANDVAKLCPEVIEQLADVLHQVAQQLEGGGPMPATLSPNAPGC